MIKSGMLCLDPFQSIDLSYLSREGLGLFMPKGNQDGRGIAKADSENLKGVKWPRPLQRVSRLVAELN